jgi:hypothetical protein
MANDDHSRQPWHRRRQHDNCGTRGIGGCGGSCNNTSIVVPHGNDSYTSCPLYLDPWTGSVQMWPDSGGGGVDVQQHLPSVMLAGALPYDLPPQQAGPTFAPSLTHLPLVAWPPWMTSGALPYGLPPQQAAPTFTSPLPPPPPTSWPPWMSSWSQQPLAHCFHTTVMVPPAVTDWVTDFSASNHTTSTAGNLTSIRPPLPTDPSSIIVSNRSSLLVTSVGTMAFPSPF